MSRQNSLQLAAQRDDGGWLSGPSYAVANVVSASGIDLLQTQIPLSYNPMPTCWIIAGPNGAGKTTFAIEYLPHIANCSHFVNADLIASGLSPLDPSQKLFNASKLFLKEIQERMEIGKDFAFETTLSGRSYVNFIKKLKKHNWEIQLIYLALPSLEASKLRVKERVLHGGHNIPVQDLERRFSKSLRNLFEVFSPIATRTQCFMNDENEPELIFEQTGTHINIVSETNFNLLKKEATL